MAKAKDKPKDSVLIPAKIEDITPDDKNFNRGTQEGRRLLEKSLRELGAGRSILLDKNNRIIAGNKTAEEAAQIGLDDLLIVETDGTKLVAVKRTDIDLDSQQGRKLALADNTVGQADLDLDTDLIAEVSADFDFDAEDWGVVLDVQDDEETEGQEGTSDSKGDKIDAVEKMLDEAMANNAREFIDMYEYDMLRGMLPRGVTEGYCQAQFLKAKYYNGTYHAVNNLYFQPKRFITASGVKNRSIIDAFRGVAEGKKIGLKGLRTATNDGNLSIFYASNYPIAAAAAAAEFPPMVAKSLYEEFAQGRNIDVLDPCHGWGGRLTGALLAGVGSYTGIDPSKDANYGVNRIKASFGKYSPETKVTLIQECFEDVDLKEESYDLALTSPPYFNVEKYAGDNQSHVRYPEYDQWLEKFYRPLICKTYSALRLGGVFLLQVGSQSYPLKDDGVKIAEECGFVVEDIRPFTQGTRNGLKSKCDDNTEKIIVLKKRLFDIKAK